MEITITCPNCGDTSSIKHCNNKHCLWRRCQGPDCQVQSFDPITNRFIYYLQPVQEKDMH